MGRILVCGLNGAGKSTVGRRLAEKLGCAFLDIEDVYFPKTDSRYLYSAPRSREEVEDILRDMLPGKENLVFSSVTGKCVRDFDSLFSCCVLLALPRDVRLARVKRRSYEKFGDRALPGGDLYEKERAFLTLVGSRSETLVEEWLETVHVPVLRMDAEQATEAIADGALAWLAEQGLEK